MGRTAANGRGEGRHGWGEATGAAGSGKGKGCIAANREGGIKAPGVAGREGQKGRSRHAEAGEARTGMGKGGSVTSTEFELVVVLINTETFLTTCKHSASLWGTAPMNTNALASLIKLLKSTPLPLATSSNDLLIKYMLSAPQPDNIRSRSPSLSKSYACGLKPSNGIL